MQGQIRCPPLVYSKNNNNLASTHRQKCFLGRFWIQLRDWKTPVQSKVKKSNIEKTGLHPVGLIADHGPSYILETTLYPWALSYSAVWLGSFASTIYQGTGKSHTYPCTYWVIGIQNLIPAKDLEVACDPASVPID